jgi:hypothetical protein
VLVVLNIILVLYCVSWNVTVNTSADLLIGVIYEKSGPDSSVGIAAGYGLDGPGIESQWGGEVFRIRPNRPWGPPSLLYNGYRVFPGGRAAGAWRCSPTPSSAEVKKRVELYIYSPSGPSRLVLGWNLPLPLPIWEEPCEEYAYRKMEDLWKQCGLKKLRASS